MFWLSGRQRPQTPATEQPLPLLRSPDVEPQVFPIVALGEVIEPAVRFVAAQTQAHWQLCACTALAAVSLATQGAADIILPTGARRPLGLFIMTIADSGERQSAVEKLLLQPVVERERELQQMARANETTRAALLTCADIPPDGLVELLKGQSAVGIFSSEGGQLLGIEGKCATKVHAAMTRVLTPCWDGDPIKCVRAGSPPLVLTDRRVTIHAVTSRQAAARLLGSNAWSERLAARFLIAEPFSTMGTRFDDVRQRPPPSPAFTRFHTRMAHLLTHATLLSGASSEASLRGLACDDEAAALYSAFVIEIEQQIAEDGAFADCCAFASKFAEQAARIAGILTAFETPEAIHIGADRMRRGILIARWFANKLLHFRGRMAFPVDLYDAERLGIWLTTKWPLDVIGIPDIVQRGPAWIRYTARARQLMGILEEHGWVRSEPRGKMVGSNWRRKAYTIVTVAPS